MKRHSSIANQLIPQSFPSVTIHTVTKMVIRIIHRIHFDRYGLTYPTTMDAMEKRMKSGIQSSIREGIQEERNNTDDIVRNVNAREW